MSRELKYLFIATYADGSLYKQTPKDTSKIDPKRSEFYDVLNSGKVIRKFSLVGDGNTITVDLLTGKFHINNLEVSLESDKLPTLPSKFELIFYRQWTENANVDYDTKSGNILNMVHVDSFGEYFIGWQCNIKGKNYQQKIVVS